MYGDVERQALIGPINEVRYKYEMPGTRYRQEFGQPLHDSQYDDL
jgi:hypothetical protein